MSTIIRTAFLLLLLGLPAGAAWDVGFDFRATSTFRTDPQYATWVNMTSESMYPTTRTINGQSVTFGWEALVAPSYQSDNTTSGDARLAGVNCHGPASAASVFRVDLPASGQYDIGIALGDQRYQQTSYVSVAVGSTSALTVQGTTMANRFIDAVGTNVESAQWVASNMMVRATATGPILRLSLGHPSMSSYSCLAHLRISRYAPPPMRIGVAPFYIQ